ncbi:hypothetical protein PYCC9005_001726 [Savitreella phatthalungensis]
MGKRASAKEASRPAKKARQSVEPWQKCPSIERAKEIDEDPPFNQLEDLLNKRSSPKSVGNILHWFRSKDLRLKDNRALHKASEQADSSGKPLITLFVHSPKDLEWHGCAPARRDFLLKSVADLQAELRKENIPLYFHEASTRKAVVPDLISFIRKHEISHVYANYEYEVDELRRDIALATDLDDVHFELLHDQCVIDPGTLHTGSGGLHKVYTPYWREWISEMKHAKLEQVPSPSGNTDEQAAKLEDSGLFSSKVPSEPDYENAKEIRKLWPAGYKAARKRLEAFLSDMVDKYADTRSDPSSDSTSRMSLYLNTGAISPRECVALCKEHNNGSTDFASSKGNPGINGWIREIVFREFYQQLITIQPHMLMNLPQSLRMADIEWLEDEDQWQKWVDGKTGYPLVDAGMRQLKAEAWMHNRVRMNTASFLRANQLIDWRRGCWHFTVMLIDHSPVVNTISWQPSYTLFHPVSQAERNDSTGDYIRKWVPELKDVPTPAIYMPFERLSKDEFAKLGYPEPCVNWEESKQRALAAYRKSSEAYQ